MPSAPVQPQVFAPASQVLPPARQFLLMLKIVLERSYQDRIDQLLSWSIDDKNVIAGVFRDAGRLFNFRLGESGLEYSPAQNARARGDEGDAKDQVRRDEKTMVFRIDRSDYEQIQQQYPTAFRYDIGNQRKARKCNGVTAYSCGGGCILNAKTCRIGQQAIATAIEMKALTQLGRQLKFKAGVAPGAPPTPAQKPLNQMTIRELRREARNRGIAGYSHINTKDVLLTTIKAWDAAPSEQRRIRKVLEKRQKQMQDDPLREIKKLLGLSRKFANNPNVIGSVLLGITALTYTNLKDRYTGNFHRSVDLARDRASGIPVEKVKKSSTAITFTVDGFDHSDDPEKGQKLKEALLKADPEFFDSQHMIAVPGPEFTMLDETPADITGRMREFVRTVKGTQRLLGNAVINGYNPQAIDLAARVMAYHQQYPDKQINLVGHSAGGMAIHEAGEIIKRMTPAGPTLAANLRVVTLGTPSFGFVGKVTNSRDGNTGRTVGISSTSDPMNLFPGVNKQLVNTVRGQSMEAYTGDERSLEVIKETLGAYDAQNANLNRPPKPEPVLPRKDPNNKADPRNAPGFSDLAKADPALATKRLVEWSEAEDKQKQREAKRSRREKAAAASVAIAARSAQAAPAKPPDIDGKTGESDDNPPPAAPATPAPPKPNPPGSGSGGSANGDPTGTAKPSKAKASTPKGSSTQSSSTAKTTASPVSVTATGVSSSPESAPAKPKRGRPSKVTATTATEGDRSTAVAQPAAKPVEAEGGRLVRKGKEKEKAAIPDPKTQPAKTKPQTTTTAAPAAPATPATTATGEVDHTAETGFTFRSAKAPYTNIDLRTQARETYGKGLEALSESQRRDLLKGTQDKLNAAIEKGYTLSWTDKEGKQIAVSRAEDIHPMDMIEDDGDVRLVKPKVAKGASVSSPSATPASTTPATTPATSTPPAEKKKRGRPPKAATPANTETATPETPKAGTSPANIPTLGSPEWQALEKRIQSETKDKTGLTSTQKAFAAARVLFAIKNGEVVELPPLRVEGKKAFETIAKMRETRQQAASTIARTGKQSTSLEAEYFVGTDATSTKGVETLVGAGLGTSDRRGYLTLNDEGKKQITALEASQKADKISLDLPGRGGKFTVTPNSLSVNTFLKGLGLQPSNLETNAAQLWESGVPDWVRSGKRGDALTGEALAEYVQRQSPAYQQAFYETAQRFHQSAKEA